MEEHKNIKLELGDVSLNEELGVYYIDFSNSLIHYSSNFYGDKDANGIPMVGKGEKAKYYPINTAQYGLLLHSLFLKHSRQNDFVMMQNCINVLESLKSEDDKICVWRHYVSEHKYSLAPGWASAMAQGECISFYLRMYQLTQKRSYYTTAIKAYEFMKIPISQNGVRILDEKGNLWLEEYPDNPPILVLNGFIYALFGLYDLYRVTNRPDVKKDIDACILTLKNRLSDFDAGFWSYYDLRYKELVRYYYQKNVHVPQLEVLFQLTQEPIFSFYKKKWENQIRPGNYLFVKLMYRVKYRLPYIYNVITRLWKK